MKIRMMSDIHLEFELYDRHGSIPCLDKYFSITPSEQDSETVLVLAGDVAMGEKKHTYVPFFENISTRFKAVIYVLGNHEFYGGTLDMTPRKIKESLQECNVYVLCNESIKIDDVTFYGTTLWTDFKNNNPLVKVQAQMSMSDYKHIRKLYGNQYTKIIPNDISLEHELGIKFLEERLSNKGNKSVVVTHHSPSYKSIHESYEGDVLNYCYSSDLDNLILNFEPTLWIHGHTHESFDYNIGQTRVICNPRGYRPDDLNKSFDINKSVDI